MNTWKNRILGILLVVAVVSGVEALLIVQAHRTARRAFMEERVARGVVVLQTFFDLQGGYPNRVSPDPSAGGWRWECRRLFEGKMRDFGLNEPHPYLSDDNGNVCVLAIVGTTSMWDAPKRDLRSQPSLPILVSCQQLTFHWSQPGDLVVHQESPRNAHDVSLEEFLRLESGPFVVGFSDGTTQFMSRQQFESLFRSSARP